MHVEMVPGLSTANVWGEVPGTLGGEAEDVLIVAHRDAFLEGAGDNATGVATVVGLAEYFAKAPPDQRRRTVRLLGSPGHHDSGSTGSQWLLANSATVLGKTALLINAEHTAYTMVDRWGPDLMPTNALGPFTWTVNGSPRLLEIANRAFDAFGIPRWATQGGPSGEFSRIRNLVPSVGLMHAWPLLHTDAETSASIPAAGLEAVTRAYARIIDEVNTADLADLMAEGRPGPN
jgi:Zn-dependent M28 family amino/carboxypeptidase